MPVSIVACETVVMGACAYARVKTIALRAKRVERRRQPARRPQKPHPIGTRRVERDQQDVRTARRAAAAGCDASDARTMSAARGKRDGA